MSKKLSLRERILRAASPMVVKALLSEGALYRKASQDTRTKWEKAAEHRIIELTGVPRGGQV